MTIGVYCIRNMVIQSYTIEYLSVLTLQSQHSSLLIVCFQQERSLSQDLCFH